jgi:hypothetical protein
MARWPTLALVVVAAGCGGEDSQQGGSTRAVRGSVELERPRGGPPDAGTAAGHGADLAVATTSRSSLSFDGRVTPQHSRVALVDLRDRSRSSASVDAGGRFTVTARGLRPGMNRFQVEGRSPGFDRWELEVRITRTP